MPPSTTTTTTTTAACQPHPSSSSSSEPGLSQQQQDAAPAPIPLEGVTNKDYTRWRPSYHLIAPHGWMNDPCAPGYDRATGTYHIGFQWNPRGADWGDIVWGGAWSRDLVRWDDVSRERPTLDRDAPYDRLGVFTGCLYSPPASSEDTSVTAVYTSVSRLPIHYTRDYHRGSETLSLATSTDGGRSWTKDRANPVLPGPPAGVDVTGWRDPYVAPWPGMDALLGGARADGGGGLFAIISGGIKGRTPTSFLYRVDAADLRRWTYVAPLVAPGLGFAPSRWTGHLGVNWEVTNFATLTDDNHHHSQDFLIFGAEGCAPPHGGAGVAPGTPRCNRAQLWIAVEPNDPSATGDALMRFAYGGIFDHGLFYAANGFRDPTTGRHVVIGWVTDEDVPGAALARQGWSGCLSLPRAVSLATLRNVRHDVRHDMTSVRAVAQEGDDGLFTVHTLRIEPEPRLERLRAAATERRAGGLGERVGLLQAGGQTRWEARGEFSGVVGGGGASSSSSSRVGLRIHHVSSSQTTTTTTTLYFSPDDETFVVERPDAQLPDSCYEGAEGDKFSRKLQDERAPFRLFTFGRAGGGGGGGGGGGEVEQERLRVRVYYDASVLEVFVNERAVITTRVYLEDVGCEAVEFFAEGAAGCVLEEGVVWDGLAA